MQDLKKFEVWFITGSQHLYGKEIFKEIDDHSQKIAEALTNSADVPVKVVFKPVVTTSDSIYEVCMQANQQENCVGIITWMHTFSPAKMWIKGLKSLQKPFLHLHTQFNRDIPWNDIDMDFMNLNQSAHGGREFGFMVSRMRINRKVVVGHWQDKDVQRQVGVWTRAAVGYHTMKNMKVARFGDNMRNVAVTEGDKVEAQMRLGMDIKGYGICDLVDVIDTISDSDIDNLCTEIESKYKVADNLIKGDQNHDLLRESCRIELGLRKFLDEGGVTAFTTTFEELHGMKQLPGFAVQRLMADGYGFGAEGDWKTAALTHVMKVMATGLEGGTSFMEDYTYHLDPSGQKVLGAHMLEVCESIAEGTPEVEIHPLGIGGKEDPIRSLFSVSPGPAINASMMDMGNRFRLVVNPVEVVKQEQEMPNLPVASALWTPKPDLKTGAAAWILAGGAHHTVFSKALTAEFMEDFAEMADMEYLVIDDDTTVSNFKKELRWNDIFYHLNRGL